MSDFSRARHESAYYGIRQVFYFSFTQGVVGYASFGDVAVAISFLLVVVSDTYFLLKKALKKKRLMPHKPHPRPDQKLAPPAARPEALQNIEHTPGAHGTSNGARGALCCSVRPTSSHSRSYFTLLSEFLQGRMRTARSSGLTSGEFNTKN